ncbi:MAG: N-acetylneuraminate synthase family protein [bacterium]
MTQSDKNGPSFSINDRTLTPANPYYVAELSANHAQDLDVARETLERAAEAGADAIKLQTYKPDSITLKSEKPPFKRIL